MKNGKSRISCAEARAIDLVDYLAGLGFQPAKIRGHNFWYYSPFRNERTPSFKINRNLNRWYDFGEGAGGSLIDFAIRLNGCTIGELLDSLSVSGHLLPNIEYKPLTYRRVEESPISVIRETSLYSYALLSYLAGRRIPIMIADAYCREITYRIQDREYYAIGFPNDSRGWELRNPYFKGSTSPKDISTFSHGSGVVSVFEGFTDFLSFKVMMPDPAVENSMDFAVLNSLSHFEKSRPFLESHGRIHLYLDNDAPGRACSLYARSLSPIYEDKTDFYKSHKDLNDFLCQFGKPANPPRPP